MFYERFARHAFVFFVLACTGCGKELTKANVPGKYVGCYAGGVEVFHLAVDGTFTQEFVKIETVIYTNSGEWSIVNERIEFTDFLTMHSWGGSQSALPRQVDYMYCYWYSDGNRARISFSGNDESYFVERSP